MKERESLGQYLRPMSTAPKDGTQIIVVGPDNDKRWAVCWDDYNKNWPTHNSWLEEDEPIGWIPIEDYASPMPRVPEGYQLVPVEEIDKAINGLEHLKKDILIRSELDETCKEGQVFIGNSAWSSLKFVISMLNASKGE